MKYGIILGMVTLIMLSSLVIATSGSFGEIAGPLVYNGLVNGTQTRTWTIINNYNYSLTFYVINPNMSNVSISPSVVTGIIKANSYFPINVTIISHTSKTESAYIIAYVTTNNTNSTNASASIRLGASKLIEVEGVNTLVNEPFSQPQSNITNSGISDPTTTSEKPQAIDVYTIVMIVISISLFVFGYYAIRERYSRRIREKNIKDWEQK